MTHNVPSRRYAHPLDLPAEGPECHSSHDKSSDAIGGSYGCSWYEYFVDRESGETYCVYCYDGVRRSKGAYAPKHDRWRDKCHDRIVKGVEGVLRYTSPGQPVYLSLEEWLVMRTFSLCDWLDAKPGDKFASVDKTVTRGEIGTIKGRRIIVVPSKPLPLSAIPDVPELNMADAR